MIKKSIYAVFALILVASLLVFYLPGVCQLGQEVPASVTEENVLNLYGIDPLTLDPAVSGEATSQRYIRQLFSGLVRLDAELELAPDIARDWLLSDDSRTYTFHLRNNVFFHDGRKVKAEDFKYSWERALNPGTASQTAAIYLGDIVGASEVLAGYSEEISGVKVIGDYTLSVTIDEPKSYFLPKLTYVTAFVVDRDNVAEGDEWWRHLNGTGPFKLWRWDETSSLVLERNELYYGDLADVEFVVFHLWAGRPMEMYEMGQIDISQVDFGYIDKVSDKAGAFYQDLVVIPELSFFYIGFNHSKPPFDDAIIRRAFSQAVDKDKLASLVFKDMMHPADGILPLGMPGFNEDLLGLTFDVDKAKELIATSSYGDASNLPPITITTSGLGGQISQELEVIIYEWRLNLGVEVEVRQLEPEVFLYNLLKEKDEMYYMGWIADYPHPQNFLELLFSSGFEYNYGEYANPEVDALLRMAGIESDSTLILDLYQQIEQALVSDVACLPLWFGQSYVLVKPYIKGYELNPLGYAGLNSVSVEPH
jgi:oligopeptide transport system substrate-binding protein